MIDIVERAEKIIRWLGWQDYSLTYNLKNFHDAEHLYDIIMESDYEFFDYLDECDPQEKELIEKVVEALGYNPMNENNEQNG